LSADNPNAEETLKEITRRRLSVVSREEHQTGFLFARCQKYLKAEDHFKRLPSRLHTLLVSPI